MHMRVVMVEPRYQMNVGYVARVAANFSAESIAIVKPRCSCKGKTATMYSKHARPLLERARIFETLREATKGSFVMGTTSNWRRSGSAFHNAFTLSEFVDRFGPGLTGRRVSVVLGRDDTGLTAEELADCDATVTIEACSSYPVLNISHALAVIMYTLGSVKGRQEEVMDHRASEAAISNLARLFERHIASNADIRDKAAVAMAFRHVMSRSMPTQEELGAIAAALSQKRKQERMLRR